MANYNNTTKDNVKTLNPKQTVIVELITEAGKKVKNIYLGNFKRRQDAFYIGMEGMKGTRKGEVKKEYRLLKLAKALAEVSVKGYNIKTNYLITENYNDEAYVVNVKEQEVPALSE